MSTPGITDQDNDLIRVEVNSSIADQLPFPSDYKFSSCFLPKRYLTKVDCIQNFKIRSDDIWIVTFPKAGTTWTMNIVRQLMNNLDFSADFLNEEHMFFEQFATIRTTDKNVCNRYDKKFEMMNNLPSRRLIKSHLAAYLLPKDLWTVKPKIIYIYRDAKDVAVSLYHMNRNHVHLSCPDTIEQFFDRFLSGRFNNSSGL